MRVPLLGWVFLLAAGCASFAPEVDEPLRVATVRDFVPGALDFAPGVTTLDEARSRLAAAGVTGIVSDAMTPSTSSPGARIEVLGGDYQRRLHLFSGGRYRASVLLPTHGVPPYGLAVRLASAQTRDVAMILYRDPLARGDVPPTLLAFDLTDVDAPRLVARRALDGETRRHEGMTHPLLVGADLDDGIMLVARDADGALWTEGYLVRLDGDALDLSTRSIGEALRCSCVRAYAVGRDVH